MTTAARRARTLLVVSVIFLMAVLAYLWIRASTHSYDQRYDDCMRAKRAYFQGNDYPAATADCARRAGLPPSETGHPDSWRAP